MDPVADRVEISYPADLSGWGRRQISTPWFKAYLRKALDELAVGMEWEEFVDVGCCGSALTVPLRLEEVLGGERMDEGTRIDFRVREACDVQGGWRVQSAAGPTL